MEYKIIFTQEFENDLGKEVIMLRFLYGKRNLVDILDKM